MGKVYKLDIGKRTSTIKYKKALILEDFKLYPA